MTPSLHLLTTPEEINALAVKLASEQLIAVDTEFMRETTFFPKLEIIQVATETECWVIDAQPFRSGGAEKIRPFLDLLKNPRVLKILHATQADQECFFVAFGITASPTLDTALASALCGYGESPGLSSLLKSVLNIKIKKGHARTNWSTRPLSHQQMEYACADVSHLVNLGKELIRQLDEHGRKQWALELSALTEAHSMYEADPEGMAARIAKSGRIDEGAFPTFRELIKWREKRARDSDVPRKWIADDSVLMDLSHVRPKDIEHLMSFRGFNRGELKNRGQEILEAIKRGEAEKGFRYPRTERGIPPDSNESRATDLLKVFVGILADRHRIAARYLMAPQQTLDLLRTKERTTDHWIKEELLTHGAAQLIGADLIDFLEGRSSLSLDGRKINIKNGGSK